MKDLKLEDLIVKCSTCYGAGEIANDDPALIGPEFDSKGFSGDCPACRGKRYLFTDAGNVLREFMSIVKQFRLES